MDIEAFKEAARADARKRKGISSNPNPVTDIWTTREGQEIRICDMADSHLLNAIRLLEEAGERGPEDFGPEPQGEMAAEAWIDAVSAYYNGEDDFNEGMEALCREADGRGLDTTNLPKRERKETLQRPGKKKKRESFFERHCSHGISGESLGQWADEV